MQVRADVTFPGDPGGRGTDGLMRPPCPIHPGAKDRDWIPVVAENGWTILTRDRHIRSRADEVREVKRHKARVITLDGRHPLNKWLELEIVVTQWRKIEEMADLPGPWAYTASRTQLRKVF